MLSAVDRLSRGLLHLPHPCAACAFVIRPRQVHHFHSLALPRPTAARPSQRMPPALLLLPLTLPLPLPPQRRRRLRLRRLRLRLLPPQPPATLLLLPASSIARAKARRGRGRGRGAGCLLTVVRWRCHCGSAIGRPQGPLRL